MMKNFFLLYRRRFALATVFLLGIILGGATHAARAESQTLIFRALFDAGSDGFIYSDDTFLSTKNPVYASGSHVASGGYSGGGLSVAVGGVDTAWKYNMSGGWRRSFQVAAATFVQVSLRYRLVFAGDYESDECGQALVAIDGALAGSGSQDYLAQLCGFGDGSPVQDTGWRQAILEVYLTPGTHTITVGGWNNKKTYFNEVTNVFFDEIEITQQVSSENDCGDGVDNDIDGLIDCDDPDCIGNAGCEILTETDCGDGLDDDGDNLIDCEDPDCSAAAVCRDLLFDAFFDTGSDGFIYLDDAFRSTKNPVYASGSYVASGGYSGGGLSVGVGGVDTAWKYNMSGGWRRSFQVAAATVVQVSLRYRLVLAGDYESDECAQALVAVDGELIGSGSQDYLAQLCGFGDGSPVQDTGWRQAILEVYLTPGTHTITVGGYNNKKTYFNEAADVFFDEIEIAQQVTSENDCGDGLDNDLDGLIDCDDPDCIGNAGCEILTETDCGDGLDDDGDFLIDCEDPDCSAAAVCQELLFRSVFDAGSDGFIYSDDTFRSTKNPAYASGSYAASGGYSGGGLRVSVGGVDNAWKYNMSGGWRRSFQVAVATFVQLSLRYRLVLAGDYESDECAQALVAVDGELTGSGSQDYLAQLCGFGDGGPVQDTGWRQAILEVYLTPGTHTITVGGYNNKKTYFNEAADVYFDEIQIARISQPVIILSETFASATADGWTVVNDAGQVSNWQVVDGKYSQLNDWVAQWSKSYHLGTHSYYRNGMGLTDYQVKLNLKSLADISGGRDSIGVMVRYQDNNNYIRFLMSRMQGFLKLESRVGGQFKTLNYSGRGIDLGEDYGVLIDVRCGELNCTDRVDNDGDTLIDGYKILVYLNNEPVFSAEDVGPTSGSIALFTQSMAEFDNVVISEPAQFPRIVIQQPSSYGVAIPESDATQFYQLSVKAQMINVPDDYGVEFAIDSGTPGEIVDLESPFAAIFNNVPKGDRIVSAIIVDRNGVPIFHTMGLDEDFNSGVGVGGEFLVAFGDSITNGFGDNLEQDNNSTNGKNLSRGYAPILNNLLSQHFAEPTPVFIANEGLGGTTAKHGRDRLAETLGRFPESKVWMILFGTNDSSGVLPTLSGVGCLEPDNFNPGNPNYNSECQSTFKGYLRDIILTLKAQNKKPALAYIPYVRNATAARQILINEYNQVIRDLYLFHKLSAVPPDFYQYFSDPSNQGKLFDDVHPNGAGYVGIADLWYTKLINSPIFD